MQPRCCSSCESSSWLVMWSQFLRVQWKCLIIQKCWLLYFMVLLKLEIMSRNTNGIVGLLETHIVGSVQSKFMSNSVISTLHTKSFLKCLIKVFPNCHAWTPAKLPHHNRRVEINELHVDWLQLRFCRKSYGRDSYFLLLCAIAS